MQVNNYMNDSLYQSEKTALSFKFLYGQGVWRGGEELGPQ